MKKNLLAYTGLTSVGLFFQPGTSGWKMTDGVVEMRDGNPVYIDNKGEEKTIEFNAISTMIGENRQYRQRAQDAETKLKEFEGIDAGSARDAIEKLSKIDEKTLVDAGKVDEVRAEIEKRYKDQLTASQTENSDLKNRVNSMALDNAFNSSKFITERVALAPDLMRKAFESNFKVEDGKVIPYNNNGETIYSNENIGQVATFDEAVSILINQRSDKDKLLLANSGRGSGSSGAAGGGAATRTYSRGDFAKLSPHEQAQVASAVKQGKAQLVD